MKKAFGIVKKVLVVLGVLFVIALFFGGGKSSESGEEETVEIEQQSETSKEEDEVVEGKKEEEVAKESDKEESAADNSTLIDETLISPEFKEAMDSYEAFFDEYVEYMKAYNDNPTDAELLMGMSDMLAREADMIKAFDEWEEDHDMTTAEEAYYLEVHSRIYAKLAEVM